MTSFRDGRTRWIRAAVLGVALLSLIASPASAAPRKPSWSVSVCLVSADTLRLTLSWRGFDANEYMAAFYEYSPGVTVGGEPDPLDAPGTSGQQVFEITADPLGETGPLPAEFNSWDRAVAGPLFSAIGQESIFGPFTTVKRPHKGWAPCP
jgi:hypothetical protein